MGRFVIIAMLLLSALVLAAGGAFAQGGPTKQVGLVIAFPDGSQHLEIVTVPQDATTFDALAAADIELASADQGFGPAICGINSVGCPADNCFCDPERFWAYYHLDDEGAAWVSAQEGVGSYTPADREVEGFAWSGFDANFNPTEQPAVHTINQLMAVEWLHTRQLADGSFGGASVTADAVYALALAGADPAGPEWTKNGVSALDALETQAAAYATRGAGEAGKVLRAVALAGGNPHNFAGLDLVAEIEKYYDSATGRYHPVYLFRHTLAVEGLARAGRPVPAKAYDTLLAAQTPNGSWYWTFDGATGDVDTTGRVLAVTAGLGGRRCALGYSRAVAYLAAAQKADGGWGVYPPPDANLANANSTALALAGLRALGVAPDDARFIRQGHTPLETLLTFQEASGAFVYIRQPGREESRLMATIEALAALSQPQASAIVCYPSYLPAILRAY